ncbi:MAG TPA: polysaccharide deacetylase family protein [Firmicutes bacterium]|jgi:peptidoglycan/xylan/chitin deacetylase (PgdA/CDA1 family)|nr:polysaccharide deacetylase family protein [Bacillota bacterium]
MSTDKDKTGCEIKRNPFNYFSPSHVYRTKDYSILLTFDDGPCENTAKILDLLKTNNIKAAFLLQAKTQ